MSKVDQMREFEIGPGTLMITRSPATLSIVGLGSCVALAMRDSRTGASGLAHIVLPVSNGADLLIPAKYADTAVPALMRGLLASGCTTREIKAKLAGGAKLLREGSFDGYENVESTRNELSKNGITIIAEDVGSTYGRSVKFDTSTGNMMIKRYHQFHGMVQLKDEIII